jgi:hypothetical protein
MSVCYLKVTSGRKGTQSCENSVLFFDRDSINRCCSRLIPPSKITLCLSFDFLQSEGEIYCKNTRKTTEVTQFSLGFSRENRQCSENLLGFGIFLNCRNRNTTKCCESSQNFTALVTFSRETK